MYNTHVQEQLTLIVDAGNVHKHVLRSWNRSSRFSCAIEKLIISCNFILEEIQVLNTLLCSRHCIWIDDIYTIHVLWRHCFVIVLQSKEKGIKKGDQFLPNELERTNRKVSTLNYKKAAWSLVESKTAWKNIVIDTISTVGNYSLYERYWWLMRKYKLEKTTNFSRKNTTSQNMIFYMIQL